MWSSAFAARGQLDGSGTRDVASRGGIATARLAARSCGYRRVERVELAWVSDPAAHLAHAARDHVVGREQHGQLGLRGGAVLATGVSLSLGVRSGGPRGELVFRYRRVSAPAEPLAACAVSHWRGFTRLPAQQARKRKF